MTDKQIAEIARLRELIDLERKEERRLHLEVIQAMPLVQRVEKGYSWYPVQVLESDYGIGERPYVILSREGEEAHQFRAGTSVNLFTVQPEAESPQRSGVIQYVKKNRMKIILGGEEAPSWLNRGGVGVDLMFDERTYVEMDKAMERIASARGDRTAELRDVIMGERPTEYLPVPHSAVADLYELNDSQREAVREVLAARHLSLIHGPPGTGKTTTLVAAVSKLVETESTVLFCAPSNSAADLVTLRMAARGIRVVRTGNISRVEDDVMQHTLEVQLAGHPDTKQIKKLRQEAAELRRKASRMRGGRDKGMTFAEAGRLSGWARQLEDHVLDHVLDSAQVIVCTLVGAASSVLGDRQFKTCIIDEAAQALEPATWIPIAKSNRVVLAGDPFQLPPTVKSKDAERGGFGVTLLEKCLAVHGRNALLNVQYRMNERIMGFSNEYFYAGKLMAGPGIAERTLPGVSLQESVVFIDTAGTGFEEKLHPQFKSRYNDGEIDLLIEHLILLRGSIPPEAPLPRVAVISPYREQVVRAEERIEAVATLDELDITVNTVDGFQGRERAVVYLSLVRSNTRSEIGFLSDYRRMNVALTRAKLQLVVIGDSATIGNDPFFGGFLEYVERSGTYQTAWEYMAS
ncbi:AAA domain-containing protein [Neolewinella xylanilytica]|uniref:AAA domain-containing protein n=1 Tax=Neolewinella xylanilytica TaxID=1514080 RepID=A0A2S6IBN1_9BACT|nr:AAA domain-containing protein [Neolewinella xylanilytica]PPK88910.1 AAA domain-containing protein [Neolewinella xylanilytica]